jgi:hypothetical protein
MLGSCLSLVGPDGLGLPHPAQFVVADDAVSKESFASSRRMHFG